jgi:DNA-nicking Smr family endonuclease
MDSFGDILRRWEQGGGQTRFVDKDASAGDSRGPSGLSPQRQRPQAEVDLHGQTQAEAWQTLTSFVDSSVARGLRKILIVHGKGLHLGATGALADLVRRYIETDPRLGASGHPGAKGGGTGATWVMIKKSAVPSN